MLFFSWKSLPHSYGICAAFLLVNLYKNYGPNGKIIKNAIEIYTEEAPYYNPEWIKKQNLVYTEEYNEILRNLVQWTPEIKVDLIYRQTFQYNINVTNENKDIPKCIFYTSEFAKLNHTYFSIAYPENLKEADYNNYISLFLKEFHNIYFTSPSEWSSRGIKDYIKDPSRDRIITHGVDTSIFFKNKKNRNEIRKMYNIKDTDILMINIGATTTNKGILLIIETLHELVNKLGKKEFKVMFKGTGDLYNCTTFLKSYIGHFVSNNIISQKDMDNLVDNHIIFTDKTLSFEMINNLYNSCDLYISPYLCEGFGLCNLESTSSGLPVLIPRTGSTKEFMENIYQNGGKEFIYYVDSYVIQDQNNGFCQNVIKVQDIVNTILKIDFKKEPLNYDVMIKYINKNLSWDYASTLLFDYFKFIVSEGYKV